MPSPHDPLPSPRRWPRRLLIALAVLAVLLAAGVLLLDRLLLGAARSEAARLSSAWGRPVEVGGLSTRLVPWLGAEVQGVRIGAGPGEPRPLFELDRAFVRVGLGGALRSLGKRVDVQDVRFIGLRVNVLRLPDGTTNLSRLAEAVQRSAPRAPAEQPAGRPVDLSSVRLGHASLEGGRVAFQDLGRPGAKELAVDQLGVELRDLAAGKPLEVVVTAAVLAASKNLEVRLRAAPLPATLMPTPERLSVKLAPVALDPLAPFLPPSVGLLAGRVEADLEVVLGGAVVGGAGPSALRGELAARGLRFVRQEGGRPLDAVLHADVTGDAEKGDVRIGKLDLQAGTATATGSGSATGLLGKSPRIDGLQVVARGLDPRALAAFYLPLRDAVGDRASGPATLELRAAGEAGAPALEVKLDLAGMKLSLPDLLAKAAGAPLILTARVAFPGGETGRVRASVHADLAGVDLRPGGSLAKAPGDRLSLAGEAEAARRGKSGWTVALKKLELLLPADAVSASGNATVDGAGAARQVHFDLAAESDHLDLDRLLLPREKPAEKKKAPLSPETFAGLAGSAQVRLRELTWSKAIFRDVSARIELQGDDLLVKEAKLTGLGGRLDAGGTRLRLAHPDEPIRVVVKLDGVDAGEALALYTPRKLLSGRVSANLDVAARGATAAALTASLAGSLEGKLFDGAFLGKDLVTGVAGPLARALPFGATKALAEGGSTSLGKELPFGLQFTGGAARITKPLRVDAAGAGLSVEGGAVKLDGTLDVPLTVALAPSTVITLTGGRARPAEPVPVTLRLTGPAWSPTLADLSLQAAVASIVRSAGSAALGKVLGGAGGALGGAVGGALGGAAGGAAKEAPKQAAQDAAAEARKKAGQEASRALQGLLGK